MTAMIRTAYLRAYQPIESFPPEERARWTPDVTAGARADVAAARRWLFEGALPSLDGAHGHLDGAFVRSAGSTVLVCPWRTRLRMLAGLITFRTTIPVEVADAFVTEAEAGRAAAELEQVEERYPNIRSHIVHANWHVPLRWFAAFDDSERILIEDADGLRVRYEASLKSARARLEGAVAILERSWIDDAVTGAVRELLDWVEGFSHEGLLELDYGSVAGMFSDDELVEDHAAAEIRSCLDALEEGEVMRAGEVFATLSDVWATRRAVEVVN
jgi:hypothetical protein